MQIRSKRSKTTTRVGEIEQKTKAETPTRLLLCTRVIGQSKKSKLKLAVKKPCQPSPVCPVFV